MIRLSICIATYNRATLIRETLESILPQVTPEVEVVIVDGASSDPTEEVCKEYACSSGRIRYVRLSEKGGVDQDFCRAVAAAQGEYCWLFADDDIAKPGAIRAVLEQIECGYELIVVNAEVRNVDLSVLIEPRRLPIAENKRYSPNQFSEFFEDSVVYMTFIGCVVIKRQVWNERELKQYFGTEFIHLGVIFQRRFRSDIIAVAEPLVAIRLGNAQWTSRAFEIWMFKLPALIWSFTDVSEPAKRKISPRAPWRHWTRLLWLRAEGNYSAQEYARFIRPRIASVYERMRLKSAALLPGRLLNALALIYCNVRFPDKPVLFFNLRSSPHYWLGPVRRGKDH